MYRPPPPPPPLGVVPQCPSLQSRNVSFFPTPHTCSLSLRMSTSSSSGSTQLRQFSSSPRLLMMFSCWGAGAVETVNCNGNHCKEKKPRWKALNNSHCWAWSWGSSLVETRTGWQCRLGLQGMVLQGPSLGQQRPELARPTAASQHFAQCLQPHEPGLHFASKPLRTSRAVCQSTFL